jgi:hypothetical protein
MGLVSKIMYLDQVEVKFVDDGCDGCPAVVCVNEGEWH